MRLDPSCKIEKCVSKERAPLAEPYLRIVENEDGTRTGTLEATDTYQLVRIPVELDPEDTQGHVTAAAIQANRKARPKSVREWPLLAADDLKPGDGSSLPRPDNGTFPNTDHLIPDNFGTFEIGLDASLLLRMAEAMGSKRVRIKFVANDGEYSNIRPIHVAPISGADGAEGILMPIRIA